MNGELQSMYENNVWTIVERPLDKKKEKKLNIIDSRWVYTWKTARRRKRKCKARLIIRSFKDRRIYELQETYAPVTRLPLIRTVFAIVNKYNLDLYQMDVKTAFLNGILEEDIYMKIPEGVDVDSET